MKTSHRTEKFMVLLGAFISQLFSAGFANTLGLFYVEFLETFDTSRVQVGWATSICSGLVFGAGLVAGIIVHKLGPRISSGIGGILSFAGLLASSFAPSITAIYLTFGTIGLGCCLVCVSSVVAVGQHFGKSRGAASALAVVGTGVGALVFPIVIRELTDHYGWRGAIMILSAMMLNTLPAAGMFVTPRSTETDKKEGLHLKKALCSSTLRKNAGYMCYLLICPIAGIGYKYTYIVIVDMGMLLGFNKALSTYLLVYISLANTISTLCFGLLLKVVWRHNVLLLCCCWVSMGAIMFAFPLLKSYAAVVTGTVMYGAAMGGNIALYAVVTADLIGLKYYSTGLGFICTSYGVGYLLSAPMAGLINDATGSYNVSFYIAGCLCFFSVITFATVLKLSKCCGEPHAAEDESIEAIEVEVQEVNAKVTSI